MSKPKVVAQELVLLFQEEITDILCKHTTSLNTLSKEWSQYRISMNMNNSCIFRSLNQRFEAKNQKLMMLAQDLVNTKEIILSIYEDITSTNFQALALILSVCYGLSFILLMREAQVFMAIKRLTDKSFALEALVQFIKQTEIETLDDLINDNQFRLYIDQQPRREIALPYLNEFDVQVASLVKIVKNAKNKFQKSNSKTSNQNESEFSNKLSEIQASTQFQLEESLYYQAAKVFRSLMTMYNSGRQLETFNQSNQQQQLQPIKTLEDLNARKGFLKHESVMIQEGQNVEYKQFQSINDSARKFIIKKVVTSFLNSTGGSLYIGVKDDLIVEGYKMSETEQDITATIHETLNQIHPLPKWLKDYTIDFIPIYEKDGTQNQKKKVIKINVKDINPKPGIYSFPQFIQEFTTSMICSFFRQNDSCKCLPHNVFKEKVIKISKEDNYKQFLPHKCRQRSQGPTKFDFQQERQNKHNQKPYLEETKSEQIFKPQSLLRTQKTPPPIQTRVKNKSKSPFVNKYAERDLNRPIFEEFKTQQNHVSSGTQIANKYMNPEFDKQRIERKRYMSPYQSELFAKDLNQSLVLPDLDIDFPQQKPLFDEVFTNQNQSKSQDSKESLQPINLDDSLLADEPEEQIKWKPDQYDQDERSSCLLMSRFHERSYNPIQPIVKTLAEKHQVQMTIFQTSILLAGRSRSHIDLFRKEVNQEISSKVPRYYFEWGRPTKILLSRNKFNNTKEEFLSITQRIMEKTKLSNFKIEVSLEKGEILQFFLRTESLEDQKRIYQAMKSEFNLHWKIDDKQKTTNLG